MEEPPSQHSWSLDTRPLNERIAKAREWGYAGDTGEWGYLPNWAGDLNLMHELESALRPGQRATYAAALSQIIGTYQQEEGIRYYEDVFFLLNATAQQKAEAWLKVKEVEHESDE